MSVGDTHVLSMSMFGDVQLFASRMSRARHCDVHVDTHACDGLSCFHVRQ